MTMIDQDRASRASVGGNVASALRERVGAMHAGDYLPSGERIMRLARERPEALLVIAAGLALLMRGAGRGMRDWGAMSERELHARGIRHNPYDDAMAGWASSEDAAAQAGAGLGERVRETGERMSAYAGELSERASETASEYSAAAGRWAEDARDVLSERSARLARQARDLPHELDEAVRDHPLVLGALGIAVGAALGASFPASSLESRAMGGAREQLGEAAQGVAGRLTDAAERALEEAKRTAERHGVSGESVREMARDAAGAFVSAAAGRDAQRSGSGSGGASGT